MSDGKDRRVNHMLFLFNGSKVSQRKIFFLVNSGSDIYTRMCPASEHIIAVRCVGIVKTDLRREALYIEPG